MQIEAKNADQAMFVKHDQPQSFNPYRRRYSERGVYIDHFLIEDSHYTEHDIFSELDK